MKYVFLFLAFFAFSANTLAFETAPAITDREIIESLTELKSGQVSIEKRFDDMGKRMDQLSNLVLWGFGVMFTGIFALIGFVLWNRRTALAPAVKKHDALENALIGLFRKTP